MSDGAGAPSFECQPLSAAHGRALTELFERAGSGCYCEWWDFAGDKNEWLARLAHSPEMNRACLLERAQGPGPSGVVAVTGTGLAVGYMKLTPSAGVPKLYAQRPYRGLPCLSENRERTFVVGCFLVDPDWRRRGVGSALLATGIELARDAGALAVEAFPRRADGLREEELWTGPYSLYRKHGFEVAHEIAQYPVVRRML